jgi:hypothetical protein
MLPYPGDESTACGDLIPRDWIENTADEQSRVDRGSDRIQDRFDALTRRIPLCLDAPQKILAGVTRRTTRLRGQSKGIAIG